MFWRLNDSRLMMFMAPRPFVSRNAPLSPLSDRLSDILWYIRCLCPGPGHSLVFSCSAQGRIFCNKMDRKSGVLNRKIGRNLSLIDIFSHFLPAISAIYYPPGSSDWRLRSFVSPSIPGSWLLAHHVSWGKGKTRKVLLEILLRCWNITPSQSYNQFPNHGTKYLASD